MAVVRESCSVICFRSEALLSRIRNSTQQWQQQQHTLRCRANRSASTWSICFSTYFPFFIPPTMFPSTRMYTYIYIAYASSTPISSNSLATLNITLTGHHHSTRYAPSARVCIKASKGCDYGRAERKHCIAQDTIPSVRYKLHLLRQERSNF
uniref:Uncharacterized protein n=1 Tax=Trichogramma kaykai TaxID=54128 RepID=A0ABD2X592_9HYME